MLEPRPGLRRGTTGGRATVKKAASRLSLPDSPPSDSQRDLNALSRPNSSKKLAAAHFQLAFLCPDMMTASRAPPETSREWPSEAFSQQDAAPAVSATPPPVIGCVRAWPRLSEMRCGGNRSKAGEMRRVFRTPGCYRCMESLRDSMHFRRPLRCRTWRGHPAAAANTIFRRALGDYADSS